MVEFITAQVLKDNYDVFGHFYSVQVAPEQFVNCRSVLEIVRPNTPFKEANEISFLKPDAVFIMMNPGSSRPLIETNDRIDYRAIHELKTSLIKAKPDATQYQVMRLMYHCQWNHVRVLNLSDLRSSKSAKFLEHYRELETEYSFDAHSVFSDQRKDELALKINHGPSVICAWGTSPILDPLIERCLHKLTNAKFPMGLLKEGTTNKFFHPLPPLQSQQMIWVQRIFEQCHK